jgi:hypothetical protein
VCLKINYKYPASNIVDCRRDAHLDQTSEAAFSDSFIVKLEKENNMEIKYEIPRLEISSLTDDRITLKLKLNEIDKKYETSSIKKSPK